MKAASSVREAGDVELVKKGLFDTRRDVRFGKIWGREEMSVGVVIALCARLREVTEE